MVRELRKNWPLFLMLLPGCIFVIIFNYIPMAGIVIAFQKEDLSKGFLMGDWIGFKNFEPIFRTPDAWDIFRNTVSYNAVFIFLGLATAVFIAIALNEIRSVRLAKFYQSLMFLPYFLSWVVVSFLVYAFLNPDYGFMNKIVLKALNQEGIAWYNEPKYWPYLLTFINLWKNAGYNSVIYFAAIMGIDKEMYEAAELDGASRLQRIWHITIPCLVPMMIIMTILAVGRIFQADFGLFYQITMNSGTLFPVTNVFDTYIYRSLKVTMSTGIASAAGFTQAVVGFALVLSANLAVRKIDPEKSLF
jgi:putative aldouronate transport system permease protein